MEIMGYTEKTNTHIGLPEEEQKEERTESLVKGIMAENLHNPGEDRL